MMFRLDIWHCKAVFQTTAKIYEQFAASLLPWDHNYLIVHISLDGNSDSSSHVFKKISVHNASLSSGSISADFPLRIFAFLIPASVGQAEYPCPEYCD
jgi:hypothetical protein